MYRRKALRVLSGGDWSGEGEGEEEDEERKGILGHLQYLAVQ